MSQPTIFPVPKFHVLCPDQTVLESLRASNRLCLALQWNAPHMVRCLTTLSPEEISQLDKSHHIFSLFPLTESDRVLDRYIGLMHHAKARGADFLLHTFSSRTFDDHESMIDWLVGQIISDVSAIYDQDQKAA